MVYMLFSIACAMAIIGLVGTGRLHAGDPRVGLLLVGNLSFIDIQVVLAGGFSGDASKSALLLTVWVSLDTLQKCRER
jgi:hypothetical protein